MLGVGMCLCPDCLGGIFDLLRRDSGPYSRFERLVRRYDGSCRDDGAVRYDGVVHDDGSHAYDDVVADDASVYIGSMSDGYIVSDDAFRLLVSRVEDRIVLDVDTVADADGTDISSQHGSIPYAAVVTHFHCSYYRRGLCQKRALSDHGPVALKFLDYRHKTKVHILTKKEGAEPSFFMIYIKSDY